MRILAWKKIKKQRPRRQNDPVVRYIKLVKAFRPQTVSLMNPSGEEPYPHIQAGSEEMKKVDIILITIL